MSEDLVPRIYESLALEYYDEQRHPTCSNFRWASKAFIQDWIEGLDHHLRVLEVGAGKSLLAELLLPAWGGLRHLVALDSSERMLRHSQAFSRWSVRLILGDCCAVPFRDETFDIIAAVLGDAYNGKAFWYEAHRLLRPNGIALFTSPSFEWAAAFRSRELMYRAEFLLRNGQILPVPSRIYPRDQQIELIESSGLLVKEVTDIPISGLQSQALSPKLLPWRGPQAPVVTGYVTTRP